MGNLLHLNQSTERPQEGRPPFCICKEGTFIGVYDPTQSMCWGIAVDPANLLGSLSPLFDALDRPALFEVDTYVLSDDPAMIQTLMSRLQRFNIKDYMQGEPFERGIPLLLLPQMAAAMQAVQMVRTMAVNDALQRKLEAERVTPVIPKIQLA